MTLTMRTAALASAALLTIAGAPRLVAKENNPVVVELFTSQGCSTCPPADKLISEIGRKGADGPVIPLVYHVDYWNQQGWTDPFSQANWTSRQAAYDKALGQDHVATPQFVFAGKSQCLGSQRDDVMKQIAAQRAQGQTAQVDLSVSGSGPSAGGDSDMGAMPSRGPIHVRVSVKMLQKAAATGKLDLLVAITQSGLTTKVKAGENAEATLHDDYVVRELQRAFTVDADQGAHQQSEFDIPLDPSWQRSSLSIVAFLQDPNSQAIFGASQSKVPAF
jgi:hypothetical protein